MLHKLENKLNYSFTDIYLLKQALTHASYTSEHKEQIHNERLEFLGDAVLELIISTHLFIEFTNAREGSLSKIRANLVNTLFLAFLAKKMDIQKYIFLGKGEEKQRGREKESILSNTMEAIIGAIYLDSNFDTVQECVIKLFTPYISSTLLDIDLEKDSKTLLQEATQKIFQQCPLYQVQKTTGKEHNKFFTVMVTLPDTTTFIATEQSVKKAEQEAASLALQYFTKYL